MISAPGIRRQAVETSDIPIAMRVVLCGWVWDKGADLKMCEMEDGLEVVVYCVSQSRKVWILV